MDPLPSLDAAGAAAWREAVATLEAFGEDPERSRGTILRYARANDDAKHLRDRWVMARSPVLTETGARRFVVHGADDPPRLGRHARSEPPLPRLGTSPGGLAAPLSARLDGRTRDRLAR